MLGFGIPGGPELWIIVGVVLLLFGAGAIPKFARSVGRAKKEFEKGAEEEPKPDPPDDGDNDGDAKADGD